MRARRAGGTPMKAPMQGGRPVEGYGVALSRIGFLVSMI